MTKAEKTAYQRSFVVRDYLASGLSLSRYCELRNAKVEAAFLEESELQKAISAPTLSRWVAAYKDGKTKALEPGYSAAKGAGATLSDREKALLQKYWLHQNKPGIAAVCDMIEQYHGISISYHIARRYLSGLPEGLKVLRREGQVAYKNKVENYISKDYSLLEVMQQVCADHHTLDIKCVEKLGDKPFRPYLTAYIDMRSRKLLSWHIGKIQPNQWTVMEVLDNLVTEHGVPECIIIDNGKDFVAKNFTGSKVPLKCEFDTEVEIEIKGVFAELGCEVVRSTPYHGQAKWIERLFGFICERFSKQYDPYCGSNTVTKPEDSKLYDRAIAGQAKRTVMLTLDELRDGFLSWATWYNNVHKQKGNGMEWHTAEEVWQTRKCRVDMPPYLRERIFCRAEVKLFRRAGVHIEGIDYYNPEFAAEFWGRKVLVKRPFKDLSKCFLYSLEGGYLGEAYSREELGLADSGITEQNLAAKKHLNKRLKKATKAYEEALGEVEAKRITIQDRHRHPMHKKFRVLENTEQAAAGAENLSWPDKSQTNPIDFFIEEYQDD
ncbi:MAG: transposase [Spirochaetota bacterium]